MPGDGANDVIQDTALTLFRRFSDYDDSRPFTAWAMGVAEFQILGYRRDATRSFLTFEPELLGRFTDEWVEVCPAVDHRAGALEACLEKLSARARQVVRMRYFDGLTGVEIGRRPGSSDAAVRMLLQRNAHLEGMKRSAPVLFTVPGQLYNNGGNGTWWMQEIERPFDHWSVLARFDWKEEGLPEQQVNFADLGLDPERDYLVFEFWTQQFLGKSKGSFKAPAPGSKGAMQVFAIREAREYPWVLSTTRHISQGGVELSAEKWDKASNTLTGTSAVIAGDPYVLTVHLPAGFKLKAAAATGEKVEVANQQETATVRIVPSATKTVEWSIRFEMPGR